MPMKIEHDEKIDWKEEIEFYYSEEVIEMIKQAIIKEIMETTKNDN